MVNETLFEIIFSNETKIESITVIESPTEVLSNFIDIAKKYIASVCKGTVIVCELSVSQETIKRDHTQYPIDTFILTPDSTKESEILVYHKIKMINPGWVYNSESTKVTLFGRIGVRTIKLGQELINKLNSVYETNLKALATIQRTIELQNMEEVLTQRENDLNIQTEEIYAAEKELMNFRDVLREEKNALFKWEVELLNWERHLETIDTNSKKQIQSTPDTGKRQKITQPIINQVPYLDELKEFFATSLRWKMWEDDTDCLDEIEKNIHRTYNGTKF
jgi:hypothetical protein